jgi:hypothetical protein
MLLHEHLLNGDIIGLIGVMFRGKRENLIHPMHLMNITVFIPTEVIIMLLKEFQNDTGLIGKIMQEEIYSKNMANRHLDIIEKLIEVVAK